MWYFYESCRFKWWLISSVHTISNIKTLKCSIKSMESMFNLRPFSENYEIYIFVPNYQNRQFMKSLIWNIESIMIRQTIHQWWFDIDVNSKKTIAYLRRRPLTFSKTVEKCGEIIYWKKWRLSEYLIKFIKNLYSYALFNSLIAKWLIYH